MTWFPRGPDTVVFARRPGYTRLSRRNEWGEQCLVQGIAVHAANPQLMAVIVRRVGGTSAFRTRDGGRSWVPIADDLTRQDAQCDFTCVALHPTRQDVVYLGGGRSRRVFVLRDGSPATSSALPGEVTQIVVDRASAGLDHTILYVATSAGVSHSTDGGAGFTHATLGNVRSLAVYQPLSGARRFYAGVRGRGLLTATAAPGPWTDHFGVAGNGLPAPLTGGVYEHAVYVDISPRQPERVYLAVFEATRPPGSGFLSRRIFVSTSPFPHATWQERGTGGQPTPDSGFDGVQLVVAPENFGPDTNDVLLFTGPILLQRSLDGGRTWQFASDHHIHHVDTRAYSYWPPPTAYYPDTLSTGATPTRATVFVGSDGGIAATNGYTDPTFPLDSPEPGTSTAYNEGATLSPTSGIPRSLNRSLQALAIHRYASNPSPGDGGPLSVVGYASTLDTGFSRHLGSTAWAHVGGGEGGPIAVRPVAGGVRIWTNMSYSEGWPGWPMFTWLDTDGAGSSPGAGIRLADGSTLRATSRLLVTPGGSVVGGVISQSALGGTRTAFVARIDEAGLATRISQERTPDRRQRFYLIAQAGDVLLAATIDQRLFRLSGAAAAGPGSVWTEITGLPAGLASPESADWVASYWGGTPDARGTAPMIAAICADASGTFYILLTDAVAVNDGGVDVMTPLLRVDGTAVRPEPCMLPPAAAIPEGVVVGEMVSHPAVGRVLFAARNGRVFRLAQGQAGWVFQDISENLPGPEVHDLWIGNISPSRTPRYVLRAATAVRGVWERDADSHGTSAGSLVYMRDHVFDPGWLSPSADGVANPLRVGERAWHWQSPDIKIDTPVLAPNGTRYYQNDPEAPAPTASEFAWIKDDSTDAAAGERARVWVQVHNRAFPTAPLSLNVWVITCRFAGGLPALPARGTESFWTRFRPDGTIDTSMVGGGWTSLGVRPVEGVDAANSKVVGFEFETGSRGDHRCIAAFVHGPGALLASDGFSESLDECAPRSRQIAQRNVDVGLPLPTSPALPPGGAGSRPTTTGPGGTAGLEQRWLVAFHNARPEAVRSTLEFDLRALPAGVGISFRLSRDCRPESITGASRADVSPPRESFICSLLRRIEEWLPALIAWPVRFIRRLFCKDVAGDAVPLAPEIWRAQPGSSVMISEIPITAHGAVFAEVAFEPIADLPEGRRYAVDLLQRVENKVVGGATIVLQTAGDPPLIPLPKDEGDERTIAGEVNRRGLE